MKVIFLLSLLSLALTTDYFLTVDRLENNETCSNGMVILHAEVNLPFNNINVYLNAFHISVTNVETEEQTYLYCFIQQYKDGGKYANIGCITRNLDEGEYKIDHQDKYSYSLNRNKFTIDEFDIEDTFKVVAGEENYFDEPQGEQELIFSDKDREENLIYHLFEYTTEDYLNIYLYLDDEETKIQCEINYGRKVVCPINADDLPSDSDNEYEVYIEDTNGNPKKNYFVTKVNIKFNLNEMD